MQFLKRGLLIVALLLATGCSFVWRPWSDYSLIDQYRLFHPDYRVENFRRLDRIFPARPIEASTTPFRFERDERPLELSYEYKGRSSTLSEFLERAQATGLLVIRNDRIIHERYFQGGSAEATFTSWSIAKSFVGTLVGMALGDGLIRSLDDPVTDYLPQLSGSGYDGVPIRHILQMSSGVDFDETYDAQFSDINRFFMKVFALGRDADAVVADYGKAEPSGQRLHYISIDTHVLSMLVRKLYGDSLARIVQQQLWQPLGMEADAFWNIDDEGADANEIAFCCLNATLRDYAKLGRLYLQQGVWNGQRLLPEGWVVEATTPQADYLQPGNNPYGGRGYAYHWWVPPDYQREYFASGVWGQYIYVSEPDNLIVVRSSADPDFKKHIRETVVVFRAIRDHLRQNP